MRDELDGFGIFKSTALEHMRGLNPQGREGFHKLGNHFSYWSYSHYWDCPLRYFWLLVDKRVPPFPPDKRGSLEGGAMHLALDKLIKSRPTDLGAWVSENAQASFDEYLDEIKEGMHWKSQTDKAQAYEKYLKLLTRACFYVKHKVFDDPSVKEIHSEIPFGVKVTPEITVGGRMDLLLVKRAASGAFPYIDIVDWKGGSQFNTSREQLMFYGLGGMGGFHLPIRFVSFAFPGVNKEQMFRFTDNDYEGFIYKLQVIAEKIQKGDRTPTTNPKSCKWCVYKDACDQKPLKNLTEQF